MPCADLCGVGQLEGGGGGGCKTNKFLELTVAGEYSQLDAKQAEGQNRQPFISHNSDR